MSQPIRVLHLEDNRDYSALVNSKLASEGFAPDLLCVDNREEFQNALEQREFDLIIADFSLPDYDGIRAMKLAHEKQPETPILLVSGTIGEEAAIESLKAGATDYVLKHWPERLVPAVRRALREAGERKSRRHAETTLLRREKLFRALSENSLDIVTVLDRDGKFTFNSMALKRALGCDPVMLPGKNVFAYIHADDLKTAKEDFKRCVQQPGSTTTSRVRVRHQDGSWRYLETICRSLLDDPEIAGVIVNSRDVTERHQLEDQLRQSQKMEAIGQLAGGVAHDFNNILTVIQGHASLLRAAESVPKSQMMSAEQIYQAAERAASLTRQLLTFSRRQVMQPKNLDLNSVVSNLTKMLGRILGEDIALQFNYAPGQTFVHADAGMMEQIALNLAVNSRDAMPHGGKLSIGVSSREIGEADLRKHPGGHAGRFACLTVTDTGSGIDPEVVSHIFEPFYTTKPVGKGTGLGLATVYGIVKQHGGWIEVESELGKGASFRVFLPASKETGSKPDETAFTEAMPRGTETILVVEDEPPVRDLVVGILKNCGYTLLTASSGREALDVWRGNRDQISLLLTDVVMPEGMTGRDLAEKLQSDKPALKAVFTSGYSSDIVGKDFVVKEGVNYLQKPYVPQKLARVIRKCLDGN